MRFWKQFGGSMLVLAGSVLPGLAADPSANPAPTGCPAHLAEGGKFHMLQGMRVFDGPEPGHSEVIARTAGRTSTWDIANVRATGSEPSMVCSFKHTAKTVKLAVPGSAQACVFASVYPAQSSCQ